MKLPQDQPPTPWPGGDEQVSQVFFVPLSTESQFYIDLMFMIHIQSCYTGTNLQK